ncbi:hypothetical protein MSG28_015054 [Choristoneura fumiferana]|uniref:Uncharacterized protein n=1 Tax=Choristoneura fumiferana TaxID=7141 RepID=A0ACC0KY24_CHOFU|nr:hypothetical protein MSG28_015054 [Choristoneura fumiferana]
MACEPLSVLILSTCLIAFWPCVLPLCFAVPILPYPMYFAKNETQEVSESNENNENVKTNGEKKKKPEPPPEKEVKEVKEVKERDESDEPIGPSKGTLVPERRRGKKRFDGSEEDLTDCLEDECCTTANCKDKNVGRDLRDYDLECDLCGRHKANLYYDSDDYGETDSDLDDIIIRPKKKPKMVNKKTKTNKITKKGSGDRCCCSHKRFGRTIRKEDQVYCLTSRNFVEEKC